MLERGLVQIYTGPGKGKTTAGFGLALRASGHGNKVLIYQFLKPTLPDIGPLGERVAVQSLDLITVKVLDEPWDVRKSLGDKEATARMRTAIGRVCSELAETAAEKVYDVIILDEIVFCLSKALVSLEDIRNIIEKKASTVEIVLTGRGASAELIALADLVTEMKSVKHPFDKGIGARKGIEF